MARLLTSATAIALSLFGCEPPTGISNAPIEVKTDSGSGGESEIQSSSDDMQWTLQQQQQHVDDEMTAQRLDDELAREREQQFQADFANAVNEPNQTIQDFNDAWNQHQF